MNKFLSKTILSENHKKTWSTFRKALGESLLFDMFFSLIFDYGIWYLCGKLWNLALSQTPYGFVTNQNFTDLFKYPLVLITGLFAVFIMAFSILFETAAIVITAEYSYRGNPIKVTRIIPAAWDHMKHIFKPKNWLMLVFVILIIPFSELFIANDTVSSLVVPEYIMEAVMNKIPLRLLFIAVKIICFILAVKLLFVLYVGIVQKENFFAAAKKSFALNKKCTFRNIIGVLGARIEAMAIFEAAPGALLLLLYWLFGLIFSGSETYNTIGSIIINRYGSSIIKITGTALCMIFMLSYICALYHKREGEETLAPLSHEDVRTGKKAHCLRGLVYIIYAGACVVISSMLFFGNLDSLFGTPTSEILNTEIEIAAHRGFNTVAPESTLPAYQAAIDAGYITYGEFDVHPTKDGVGVIMHDANTKRTTGVDADISSLTLEQIKQLDAGAGYDSSFEGTEVPTLEEVLSLCQGKIKLIVEIKNHSHQEGFEEEVVELLEKYDYVDNCVVQSGSYESLQKVKAANPNIKCGLILAMAVGSFYDLEDVDFFSMEHTFITENVITQAHARNKKVFAWTVDEDQYIDEMISLGVDCIISDYPDLVESALKESKPDLAKIFIPSELKFWNSMFAYGAFDIKNIKPEDFFIDSSNIGIDTSLGD